MEDVMAEPVSLSIGKISEAAKASVERALAQHTAAFPKLPPYRLGYVPPRWWFGFVIYNQNIDKVTFGDMHKLASTVHSDIAGKVPGVKDGKPGVSFGDGYITLGFAPPIDVNLFEA
jgi:hypothetical protein